MTCFEIKDKIDNYIYDGYNLYSQLRFKTQFCKKIIINRNKVFKNKHQNERCFILGTGPSLKKLTEKQLAFIKSETVFGVNSLYSANFLCDVIPSYYFLVDNAYWGDEVNTTIDVLNHYKGKGTTFFTDVKANACFENIIKECCLNEKCFYYLYANRYPHKYINNDLCGNMTIGMNVVGTCIMTAMYMGFKEIYLLGCDYTAFASLLDDHCYDANNQFDGYKKNNLAFYLKYYEITTKIHYMIENHASQNNVKIVNLTEGSLLDAYRRGKIEELYVGI